MTPSWLVRASVKDALQSGAVSLAVRKIALKIRAEKR